MYKSNNKIRKLGIKITAYKNILDKIIYKPYLLFLSKKLSIEIVSLEKKLFNEIIKENKELNWSMSINYNSMNDIISIIES